VEHAGGEQKEHKGEEGNPEKRIERDGEHYVLCPLSNVNTAVYAVCVCVMDCVVVRVRN
jgi:hypothetical protein